MNNQEQFIASVKDDEIARLEQQLAAEKARADRLNSACEAMRRLLEMLKTGPVFRDEVDHALSLMDGKQ